MFLASARVNLNTTFVVKKLLNDHYSRKTEEILSSLVFYDFHYNFEIYFLPSINSLATADEHLAELMPIFERLRQQEQLPCAFPLHMGAGGTVFIRSKNSKSVPLSPHAPHCHPTAHWVSFIEKKKRQSVF